MPKKLFQKGKSGNPSGRPKGKADPTKELFRQFEDHPEKLTAGIKALIELFVSGDIKAAIIVFERLNGKVSQPLSNPDGSNINLFHNIPGMGTEKGVKSSGD